MIGILALSVRVALRRQPRHAALFAFLILLGVTIGSFLIGFPTLPHLISMINIRPDLLFLLGEPAVTGMVGYWLVLGEAGFESTMP